MSEPITGPWSRVPHRLAGAQHMRVIEDEPAALVAAWSWHSFTWGAVAGIYGGAMVTLAAAYAWSFFL